MKLLIFLLCIFAISSMRQRIFPGDRTPPLFNMTTPAVTTPSPLFSNLTLYQPPLIPSGLLLEKYRIIPPHFFDRNYNDFITLRNTNNMAVMCNADGSVTLSSIIEGQFLHLWFPEMISENLIRLRSYNGGYLYHNFTTQNLMCDSRQKDFLNRFDVFVDRANVDRRQCLFLMTHTHFLGFENNRLVCERWGNDASKFCFVGSTRNLQAWRGNNIYPFKFNPNIIFNFDTSMMSNSSLSTGI